MNKLSTLLKIRMPFYISLVLVWSAVISFNCRAQSETSRNPTATGSKGSAIELIELRDEYSRTYQNMDGSFSKQQSNNPIHFKDASGKWIEIQQTPERNAQYPHLIEMQQTDLPIVVNANTGLSQMFLKKNKQISFGHQAKIFWLNEDQRIGKTVRQSNSIASHTFDEDQVVLKNVFPKIDRKQVIGYDHLRTDYIINQSLELPDAVEYVVFEDLVSLPANWNIRYGSGEMTKAGWKGELEFTDENGVLSGKFSIPVFYDNFQSSNKSLLKSHFIKGTYKIEKSGTGYIVQILVPAKWLNSPERVYPVTIDPTVSGTKVEFGNVKGYAYDNACQEILAVNVPAGIITNTATTYNILARNGGWRSEQVSRVGCDFWSADQTNANGSAGTQNYNLAALTIANGNWCGGIKTFVWQAYRTWDSDGFSDCDGYNQVRTGDWVVTVTYNAVTAPANVGWSGASGATPTVPTCGNWSATWCAGSGTSTGISFVQGVNYTVENTGAATCGIAMPSAYLQAWWSGGTTACGYGAIGSPALNSISFNAQITGNHIVNVSSACGALNSCGQGGGHDFTGSSAVLRYRQNTTVTNTTSTADICLNEVKSLSATLGGAHNNPTIVWSIVSGGGSIAGTTYTPASTGSKTIRATVGNCSADVTFNVVNGNITPTFNPVAAICAGGALAALPTTSTNGITGSWSPALNNMNTTTYTFTPNAGQCATTTTLNITVNSNTTPTFNPVAAICAGGALAALPTTSTNGITGSWSPALDNMNTTTYTFTPNAGQCATTTTLNITVNSNTTPTFNPVAAICAGDALAALPTTSTNGITGSWSPALDNMNTTTYTFTPNAGQCATTATLVVTVNSNTTPTFNPVADICAGDALAALPTTSTNGITGSWSPALDNLNTTTYTFTPDVAQCATTTTLGITVKALPTASVMASDTDICPGETSTLTASGGTSYAWSPSTGLSATTGAVVNASPTTTQTYTVVATDNGCSDSEVITITVTPIPVVVVSDVPSVCAGESATLTASGAVTYSWAPATGLNATTGDEVIATPTATQTYTVTGTDGLCQTSQNITITVKTNPTVTVNPSTANLCAGNSITLTGVGAVSYIWLPTLSSGGTVTVSPSSTTTYTALGTAANGCVGAGTATVTVTTPPSATISYAGLPFCSSMTLQQPVTLTGTTGGTYTSTPGLSIDAATGAITPSTSSPGTYTVTYSIPATGGCALYTTTTSVTIYAVPVATINYPGSPFCSTLALSQNVALTGSAGGVYSSTAGLDIDPATGAIIPSSSIPGAYTVTYSIPAANGCPVVNATASVTITDPPTATIEYAGTPFCTSISSAEPVNHTGTSGGTYSGTAGLSIDGTGAITPSTSSPGNHTVTYTIAAAGGCPAYATTTSVEINTLPSATISYAGSPFCGNLAIDQNVTQTGSAGGTYTSTGGLTIDPLTGSINPSTSSAGNYTVTYTIAAASGCPAVTATTSVTITTPPTAAISYLGSPYCTSLAAGQPVDLIGSAGGTYSSTAGLTIDATTGAIMPSTSSDGAYTITYTIAASGGCPVFTTTANATITAIPTATISYPGSPFCGDLSIAQNVSLVGTVGGTFTSTAGLTIDPITGAITPSTSTPGTYTVTYTIAAGSGCPDVTVTTSVTITLPPSATIAFAAPFCMSVVGPQAVIQSGTLGGTYSSTAGLTLNALTGSITPSSSSNGTYTVIYTIAAAGGCPVYTTTTTVDINPIPTASISYTGSPFCGNITDAQIVSQTGTVGGTYTSTAGLSIDVNTGAITPSTSTPGMYTVTYTIAASGGCAAVTATTSVTINPAPDATISYLGSPFCKNLGATQAVSHSGTTGGTFSSTAGLTINASTGAITPSSSTAGTYVVTYTIGAGGGCPAYTTTTSVTITDLPVATIVYPGSPFCGNLAVPQNVSQTGTTGGTYTSTAGLDIDALTGAITPSESTVGIYTVTYTVSAAGGCPAVTATNSITISPAPSTTISYPMPICISMTSPISVNHTGTTGGTYSSTAGLTINAATGAITPSTSAAGTYTVTYSIAAAGGCPLYTTTTLATINAIPTATISYTGSPFCGNLGLQNVTQTGTAGGTYTSTPGLSIDAASGAIDPSASSAGTYTVTYTILAASGCPTVTATTSVTITTPPSATISYAGSPFCNSVSSPQSATHSGTTGGIYSSTPGLTISAINGTITPSSSVIGTYTVTYTMAAANGCPASTATTSVTVNAIPVASISYAGSPFCGNLGPQNVTQTGTAGGTYSSTSGLSIDAASGAIDPSTSTAGTYTVTYTISAGSGCPAVTATAVVTITAPQAATISYAGSPFCNSLTTGQAVTHTGTTGGTYSSTAGLTISAINGTITPSSSVIGTYTVTYTMAAANGCPASTATTSVTVNAIPVASISYTGSPFCGNLGPQNVTQTGTAGGTYSSTSGLSIDAASGAIDPSTSTAGTYTVTYTISAGGGCPAVTATAVVTITAPQAATISYAGSPFCNSLTTGQAVTHTGTTGGTYSSTAGLTIHASTGAITPSTSLPGTYNVTYTMAAANGCPVSTATTTVVITEAPAASISYSGSPYCTSEAGAQPVTLTGTNGGTFSAPIGLAIDAITGAVDPSLSTAGTYTVSYTVAAAGGCAASVANTTVTINSVPTASISYSAAQFCSSIPSAQPVILTGSSGGTYSSSAGLSIDAVTGAITPSLSVPGNYIVTYDITPAGCSMVSATTTIEIVLSPTASINYSGPFCASVPASQPVILNGTGNYTGGTYTASPAGLSIDATTGAITPNLSAAGTYLVTYTVPASFGCSSGTATVNVTITATPSALISYTSPFCSSESVPQTVIFSGNTGGTFTSTAGLSIDASTGEIVPSTSTPGTYVVTYTTLSAGGCPPGTATSTVEVLASPDIDDLADQTLCDVTYTLPAITGTSLTGNEMYFTATNGGGISYVPGEIISATTTLFIYDANGSCSNEETFTVTINQTPVIANPGDQTACGTYVLPAISGSNLSGSEAYYNNSQALGGTLITGSLSSTQTVWIYDANGSCSDEESFLVTINPVPDASFTVSDYCGGIGNAPIVTGAAGGTFDFNPAVTDGASIDATTGVIIGGVDGTTYTIEYTVSGLCPVSTQEQVTFNAVPASPAVGNDTTYCSAETFVGMTANAGSGGTLTWFDDVALTNQVGTGATVVPENVVGVTTYYVTETVSGCMSLPASIDITVNASPTAPIVGNDVTYCKGDSINNLVATGIAGSIFNWYDDAALTNLYGVGGSVAPLDVIGDNTYYVTQTSPNGCESVSVSVTVSINDCFVLEVSSAFTPGDGDNVNNFWEIPELNLRYPDNRVTIFNRWGQLLFESNGYATPWDGTYKGEMLPVGSYYYIIEFNDVENTPNATGTVTIIRN